MSNKSFLLGSIIYSAVNNIIHLCHKPSLKSFWVLSDGKSASWRTMRHLFNPNIPMRHWMAAQWAMPAWRMPSNAPEIYQLPKSCIEVRKYSRNMMPKQIQCADPLLAWCLLSVVTEGQYQASIGQTLCVCLDVSAAMLQCWFNVSFRPYAWW